MIWLVFIALGTIAIILLLRPFLWPTAASDLGTPELAVYRDQLSELESDLTNGLISPAEAEAARNEIKRKILAVAPAPEASHTSRRTSGALVFVFIIAASLPLALGLYVDLGQPGLVGNDDTDSAAMRTEGALQEAQLPDIETLAARLAERLKKAPDDAQGWRLLGLTYASLDRASDAAMAYERAVALDSKNAALLAQYGEALVGAENGVVTPQAEQVFARSLAIEPAEPRALFFGGLALAQRGKPKQALAIWIKLLRDGNSDAEWMPALRQRAIDLALKLKLDPAKEVPGAATSPTPKAAAAPADNAPRATDSDPAGTIERLSKTLETSPKDFESWILLARSYRSLGKNEMARASLARAREIFAGAPFVLEKIASAEAELAQPSNDAATTPRQRRGPSAADVAAAVQLSPAEQNAMIESMVAGLEDRLRQNANDLDGWLMLARSRKVMGDLNAARTAIERAKELFGESPQARARIAEVAAELNLN